MKIFNGDPFRHIAGIAKIMLTGIRSAYQARAGWPATCGYENAVADNEFSPPCTSVVGAQVDEAPSADRGVLHSKGSGAYSIDSHMSQGRAADGSIGYSHVGVEPGKSTIVIKKILAVVGTQDSPVHAVIDVIGLAAVHE